MDFAVDDIEGVVFERHAITGLIALVTGPTRVEEMPLFDGIEITINWQTCDTDERPMPLSVFGCGCNYYYMSPNGSNISRYRDLWLGCTKKCICVGK